MKYHSTMRFTGEAAIEPEGGWEIYCAHSEEYFVAELGEQTCPKCGDEFEVIERWEVREP